MAWVVTTSTSFANLSCNHAKWESSGEFSNGLYQDRKHFCIFCAALNVTVEHNATGQGIDEANSPKNLANASTTVGSLSWHLIHESMSSVHLASSCYLLRCFLKSYGILGSLQGKEQKTRPCGPVALPAWQWSCSPSFGPHTSGEPGQASFAAFVLHAELRSYNTIQYHQIPQARGAPIYAELTESLLSARTWKECCPMLPPACNRSMLRHLDQSLDLTRCWSTSSPGSYPRLLANDTSRWQPQRLYLPLDPPIISTRIHQLYMVLCVCFSAKPLSVGNYHN